MADYRAKCNFFVRLDNGDEAHFNTGVHIGVPDEVAAHWFFQQNTEPLDRAQPKTREALDAALAALPDGHTDPEYVVNAMRGYFGDLFTADDEAKVRAAVVVPTKKSGK